MDSSTRTKHKPLPCPFFFSLSTKRLTTALPFLFFSNPQSGSVNWGLYFTTTLPSILSAKALMTLTLSSPHCLPTASCSAGSFTV